VSDTGDVSPSGVREGTGLAVVIVNFNTREALCACIASALAEGATAIVVADNGSDDGSVDAVRQRFPSVIVDVDASNPGYGAAANRAIRRCAETNVLLLNSDTRLRAGALAGLSQYLVDHPGAGIVGPKLLNSDGTL
jgi:GT2 family glycosyltransferase